jgi:hypothetical protein
MTQIGMKAICCVIGLFLLNCPMASETNTAEARPVGADFSCEPNPTQDLLPDVVGRMTGASPAWMVDTPSWRGEHEPVKTLWVLRRTSSPVRISGRRLDGSGSAKLRRGVDTTPSETQASAPGSPDCPREVPLEPGPDARNNAIAAVERSLRAGPQDWRIYEIVSAYPATNGKGFSIVAFPMCGPVVGGRTWVVEIRFPNFEPAASLSHGQAFVSRFRAGWRVWYRYH